MSLSQPSPMESGAAAPPSSSAPPQSMDMWANLHGYDSASVVCGGDDDNYCFACLKSDLLMNLQCAHGGRRFHNACWNAIRSHNRQVAGYPAIKAAVEKEYREDPSSWRRRIAPWLSGNASDRKEAAASLKRKAKEFEMATQVDNQKELEDTMCLTEIEFMAFEANWHLQSHDASNEEFQKRHTAQGGIVGARGPCGSTSKYNCI